MALSAARMKEWMGADLSGLDIMVVQIDGIHISEHLMLVAALGIDSEGVKHPLGLMEGATEHSAVVQALIDDLIERGLDPAVHVGPSLTARRRSTKRYEQLGSTHRSSAVRFTRPATLWNVYRQLCTPRSGVCCARLGNSTTPRRRKIDPQFPQRLERDAPGVSKSILEGLDDILTVSRPGLPAELRRSLACTNIIENMMGTVRRVTRNVKRWSSPSMALRWTAAAMHEAKKGFRRLKAFRQLPALRAALAVTTQSK